MTVALMAPLALTAGVLSFSSPCCLPLLPGYLAYMTGLGDARDARDRSVRVRAAILFVVGFTAVFTALGVGVSLVGARVAQHMPMLTRASGIVLIAAGIITAGIVRPRLLLREARPGLAHARRGPGGAVMLGAAFAAGWSPCIGPVLASILALSARTTTAWSGAGLLALYSVGLGLPFVLLAAGLGRESWVAWTRRHSLVLERAGGALLVGVGVLIVTGGWDRLMQPLQRTLSELQWPPV